MYVVKTFCETTKWGSIDLMAAKLEAWGKQSITVQGHCLSEVKIHFCSFNKKHLSILYNFAFE